MKRLILIGTYLTALGFFSETMSLSQIRAEVRETPSLKFQEKAEAILTERSSLAKTKGPPVQEQGPIIPTRIEQKELTREEQILEAKGIKLSTESLVRTLMEHPEVYTRIYAARVLAERKDVVAIPPLVEQLAGGNGLDFTNWDMKSRNQFLLKLRVEAALALAKLGDDRGRVALRELFNDPEAPKTHYELVNAAGELAELGDSSGYEMVKRVLKEQPSLLLIHAVQALPSFKKVGIDVLPDILFALEVVLQHMKATDPVQAGGANIEYLWVSSALIQLGDQRALAKLEELKQNVGEPVRSRLEVTIRQVYLSDAHNLIEILKSDPDEGMRIHAAWSLGEKKETGAIPQLVEALADKHPDVRLQAALALVRLGDERGRASLKQMFQDPVLREERIAIGAARALAELGDSSGLEVAVHALEHGSWPRKFDAVRVLMSFKQAGVDVVPLLLKAVDIFARMKTGDELESQSARDQVVWMIAQLEELRDQRAIPKLRELTESPHVAIRTAAKKAVARIEGPKYK